MIEVPVLKEIRSYKTKLIGPFTTRQCVCIVAAAAGTYAMRVLLQFCGFSDSDNTLILLGAIPGAAFGWVRPLGLNLEVYLKTAFIDNVVAPKVRPYQPETVWHDYLAGTMPDEPSGETGKKKIKKKDLPPEWQGGR